MEGEKRDVRRLRSGVDLPHGMMGRNPIRPMNPSIGHGVDDVRRAVRTDQLSNFLADPIEEGLQLVSMLCRIIGGPQLAPSDDGILFLSCLFAILGLSFRLRVGELEFSRVFDSCRQTDEARRIESWDALQGEIFLVGVSSELTLPHERQTKMDAHRFDRCSLLIALDRHIASMDGLLRY